MTFLWSPLSWLLLKAPLLNVRRVMKTCECGFGGPMWGWVEGVPEEDRSSGGIAIISPTTSNSRIL